MKVVCPLQTLQINNYPIQRNKPEDPDIHAPKIQRFQGKQMH